LGNGEGPHRIGSIIRLASRVFVLILADRFSGDVSAVKPKSWSFARAIGDFILPAGHCALRRQFPQAHLEVLGYPHIAQLVVAGWFGGSGATD